MRRPTASLIYLAASCGLYVATTVPYDSLGVSTEADLPGLHVGPDMPTQILRLPIEVQLPADADPETTWVHAGLEVQVHRGLEALELAFGPCGGPADGIFQQEGNDYGETELPLTVCREAVCSTSLCLAARSTGDQDALLDADPTLRLYFDSPIDQDLDTSEAWIEARAWTLDTAWPFEGEAP